VTEARVLAQAKINLLLRVLGRETSGYHAIETVFLRVDLADVVTVRVGGDSRSLDCIGTAIPVQALGPPEKNLAYRAAVAYADATGWPDGFAIEVEKHIPVGGGLGGGSADAGAVLRALDCLAPSPLGHRLPEIATALGADVPFMTMDSPMALAWGRGERLLPLAVLAPRPVALLVPDFSIGTADAYGWLAASRGSYVPQGQVIAPESLATWEGMIGIATNDFDDVVRARYPIIGNLVGTLEAAGADIAMLSGSGSTVFGVFPSDDAARSVRCPEQARLLATQTSERVVRVESNR
jgi:4-diphosphocytidyl-2-C-methyl-D-erythritol kinase